MHSIEIFDPRSGNSFTFGIGADETPTIASSHVVVYVPPQVDILNARSSRVLRDTFECLATDRGEGIASCIAAPTKVMNHVLGLSDPLEVKELVLGYFTPSPQGYREAQELICAMEYGSILVGNLESKLPFGPALEKEISKLVGKYGIDYLVATNLNLINWLIEHDTDNGQTTLVGRIAPEFDKLLNRIRLEFQGRILG
jgi:hypothetical protein